MDELILDKTRLSALADEHREKYERNHPFPHIVMDDVIEDRKLSGMITEFPGPRDILWKDKNHEYSKKATCDDWERMGPRIRQLIMELNSGNFVDFLEALTGITGIVSDPHLVGGGLHQIRRGGFLDIHADFNVHPRLQLERRLNVLLFLNDQWREEFGGHLELWSQKTNACGERILPIANRMVVFSTTDTSFHGHPAPLTCPEDRTRNSIALYYYTKDRPKNEKSRPHSTLYRAEMKSWKARLSGVFARFGR